MRLRYIGLCVVLAFCGACSESEQVDDSRDPLEKVEIELGRLDEDGLRGPADGKVAVAYEFAIPNTERHKQEVREIDSSVEFMCGSRGRIGAGKDQCLCIGSTHQENYREVLRRLSELDYVARIIECHFE